jgi:agmatine deiminase
VDWQYNAWGGKYPPFDRDNEVPQRIAELLRVPRFAAPIVLEGGSIETNGAGTMLTTTTCLLNPNRNPQESRQNLERYLREFVGASTVIWLAGEIAGDDTDGHIDQLARFVNETTVVACCESDAADENYLPLRALATGLRDALTDDGQVIDLVFLPMPRPVIRAGQRLPASYANFYITDSAVLVPQFSDPADDRAIGLLREHFPQRDAIGLPSRDLVLGLGGLHCLTQQQPADVSL